MTTERSERFGLDDGATGAEHDPVVVAPPATGGMLRMGRGGLQHAVIAGAARLLALAGTAVFVRHLSREGFGVYSLALLNEQVVFILVGYSLANAMGKFYSDARRGIEDERAVVGTAVYGMLVLALAGGLAWQLIAAPVSGLTLGDGPGAVASSRLIGLSTASSLVLNVVLSIWLLNVHLRPFAIATIAQYGLAAGAGAVLVAGADFGPEGAVAGWAIGTTVAAIGSLIWVFRHQEMRFDGRILRRMLRYGLPLVPGALTMLVLTANDRYIVRGFEGLGQVGVYSAALAISSGLYTVIVAAFKRIWTALMWDMRAKPGEVEFHRRALVYYVLGQTVVLLAVAVYAEVALGILSGGSRAYVEAAGIVAIVYSGWVVFGAWDVLSAGYFFEERTIFYSVSVAAATLAAIAFNLALVPVWGIWAAALSNPLSYIVMTALSALYARRYFKVPHAWSTILRASLLCGVAIAAALGAREGVSGLAGEVVAAAIVIAFPGVLYALAGIGTVERAAIRGTVRDALHRRRSPAGERSA